MRQNNSRYLFILIFCLILFAGSCTTETPTNEFSERVKVALRAVGNDVLLSQNDTVSLVLPVLQLESNVFELSFEKPLAFDPGNLNAAVANSFSKASLPKDYRVAVLNCTDGEVAYSFEMRSTIENSLVPCGGRLLPEGCYTIEVTFTSQQVDASKNPVIFYILVFLVIVFLAFVFYSRFHAFRQDDSTHNGTLLGSFTFFPEQNKLVKEAEEISLSRKECELLALFIAKPNEVIKREELTKKVWEDNGVIVGRSLDTYISKLRKKLQDDPSIKLTNVHGVGYKLELT